MIGMFCGDVHVSRTALDFLVKKAQDFRVLDTLSSKHKVFSHSLGTVTATSPNNFRNNQFLTKVGIHIL